MSVLTILDGDQVTKDPAESRVFLFDWDTYNLAAAVTKLSLTDPASALDRRRKGLSKVRMEPRSSALQCRERHPERVGKHTIETNRVIS